MVPTFKCSLVLLSCMLQRKCIWQVRTTHFSFVQEVLRMYPPVGVGQIRVAEKHDIVLGGKLHIPAGTILWVSFARCLKVYICTITMESRSHVTMRLFSEHQSKAVRPNRKSNDCYGSAEG